MGKIVTNRDFIRKAELKHGKRYDYSLTNYECTRKKVKIICQIHGVFEIVPNYHLNGGGCPKCCTWGRQSNTNEFIEKSKRIHGDKYNYSKVNYKKNSIKVIITCSIHGDFNITPDKHLGGAGCQKCALERRNKNRTKTKEEFIQSAKAVHGNRYDYSKVVYKNQNTKVTIVCSIHGDFETRPSNHIFLKNGCRKCANKHLGNLKRKDTEYFVKKAKEIHGDKYDYSKSVYIEATANVIVICREHGEFLVTPDNHIRGRNGCPYCHQSKGEERIALRLDRLGISYERQKRFDNCKDIRSLPFDFYLELDGTKILIEYDGEHHFENREGFGETIEDRQRKDNIKTLFALNNGYHLIRIPYTKKKNLEEYLINQIKKRARHWGL